MWQVVRLSLNSDVITMRLQIFLHVDGILVEIFHGFVIKYDNIIFEQKSQGKDNENFWEGSVYLPL